MNSKFTLSRTPLEGVVIAERKPLGDERGFLERLFCQDALAELLDGAHVVQINRTFTAMAGTVRGMHFQRPPHAEIKFVSCITGSAYDVALDLRPDSPTYLSWHGVTLRAGDRKTVVIPEGFAHGLQTLSDETELLYFHTAAYAAWAEGGINATDPRLAIAWPIAITCQSARDRALPLLRDANTGLLS